MHCFFKYFPQNEGFHCFSVIFDDDVNIAGKERQSKLSCVSHFLTLGKRNINTALKVNVLRAEKIVLEFRLFLIKNI